MEQNMDQEKGQAVVGATGLRRLSIVVAAVGVGAVLAYLFAKVRAGVSERSESFPGHAVDDRGTGQKKAKDILRTLRDRGFEASDEKLALALGRPIEEIQAWNTGGEMIDDDVVMKARGIAMNRGIRVE